jgi:four helix bundle protein
MRPYERFAAWRLCHELGLEVYRVTRRWPSEERYGLVSQARRAAFSAAVNIVEGAAKFGGKEFRRYLDISLGSLEELAYCFHFAHDLGLLPPEDHDKLESLRRRARGLTWLLYRSLGSRVSPEGSRLPPSPPTPPSDS